MVESIHVVAHLGTTVTTLFWCILDSPHCDFCLAAGDAAEECIQSGYFWNVADECMLRELRICVGRGHTRRIPNGNIDCQQDQEDDK